MRELVQCVLARHKMTGVALAGLLGVTERTVLGWKAGKVTPPVDTIMKLENMNRNDWRPPAGVTITDRRKSDANAA